MDDDRIYKWNKNMKDKNQVATWFIAPEYYSMSIYIIRKTFQAENQRYNQLLPSSKPTLQKNQQLRPLMRTNEIEQKHNNNKKIPKKKRDIDLIDSNDNGLFNYHFENPECNHKGLPINLQFIELASRIRNLKNKSDLLFRIQSNSSCQPKHQGYNFNIQKGEKVLTIPMSYIIRSNQVNNPLANTMKLHNISNSHLLMMSEFITDPIPYKSYFNQALIDLSNFPLYYSEEQLKNLKGSYVLEEIQTQKELVSDLYIQLSQFINISKLEFDRLYLFLQSRTFSYQVEHSALVPWAEIVQHGNENMMDFDFNDSEFYFKANYDITKGTELTFRYQKHTNQHLLNLYGFTLQNNIYQASYFELCMNRSDRLYAIKLAIIGVNCTFYILTNDIDSFQGPLSYFRMLEITSLVDLIQLEENMLNKKYQHLISIILEKKALQNLKEFFNSQVATYSIGNLTKLQDAVKYDIANIIQMEISIYKYHLETIELVLELLRADNLDLIMIKLNKEERFKPIKKYALSNIIPNIQISDLDRFQL